MPDSKIAMNNRRLLSEHALKNFFRSSAVINFGSARLGIRNRSTVAAGLTVSRLFLIAHPRNVASVLSS